LKFLYLKLIFHCTLWLDKPSNEVQSYRPTALLSVDYKLLERLVCNRISDTINSVIPIEQADFRAARNCCNQVLTIKNPNLEWNWKTAQNRDRIHRFDSSLWHCMTKRTDYHIFTDYTMPNSRWIVKQYAKQQIIQSDHWRCWKQTKNIEQWITIRLKAGITVI